MSQVKKQASYAGIQEGPLPTTKKKHKNPHQRTKETRREISKLEMLPASKNERPSTNKWDSARTTKRPDYRETFLSRPLYCIISYSFVSFPLQYQDYNRQSALPRVWALYLPCPSVQKGLQTSFWRLEIPLVLLLEIKMPCQQRPWRSPPDVAQGEWRIQQKIFWSLWRAF